MNSRCMCKTISMNNIRQESKGEWGNSVALGKFRIFQYKQHVKHTIKKKLKKTKVQLGKSAPT